MRSRRTAVRALLSLTAMLVLALAGTAIAHHDDWFGHSEPAGTISSFDPSTGMLTINLANGGGASGTVSHWTWIDCGDHHWSRHRDRSTFDGSDVQGNWQGQGGWDHHSHCSTEDLTTGTVVDDAVLGLQNGSATFFKIDLEGEHEESGSS